MSQLDEPLAIDAYLANLAVANGGLLALFDTALAHRRPDAVVLVGE